MNTEKKKCRRYFWLFPLNFQKRLLIRNYGILVIVLIMTTGMLINDCSNNECQVDVQLSHLYTIPSKKLSKNSYRNIRFANAAELRKLNQDPNCPTTSDLPNFVALRNCWVSAAGGSGATDEEVKKYFDDGKDISCARRDNHCNTEDSNFSKLPDFRECERQVGEVFQQVLAIDELPGGFSCVDNFRTVTERCNETVAWLANLYCPELSFAEEYGPIVFPLLAVGLILIGFVGYTVKQMNSKDPIEQQEEEEKVGGFKFVAQPGSTSSFHGVRWDMEEAKWKAVVIKKDASEEVLGYFENENDAANAYDQRIYQLHQQGIMTGPTNFVSLSSGMHISPSQNQYGSSITPASNYSPSNEPIIPQPIDPLANAAMLQNPADNDDEETIDSLKEQLVSFYEFHDPDRGNIEEHVDSLFSKYNFRQVARAVKKKYGVLPPGWEIKLDRAETQFLAQNPGGSLQFNMPAGY